MIRSFLTITLLSSVFALSSCQPEKTAEPEIEETAPSEPVVHAPDPGKLAMETADSLEAYQAAVRDGGVRACTWTEKDGALVPLFYRNATIEAFFDDLTKLAAEDESAADARLNLLDAEFDDCVVLTIPRTDETGTVEPIDLNGKSIFAIDGRYEGMAENMFRLADSYAHPITYVCPVQVDKGSRALIAYDSTLKTLWSDDIDAALSEHLDKMFPDMGLTEKPFSIASATADELTACRDAYIKLLEAESQ